MTVSIVGAGNMARGIATRLLGAGVDVQLLSTDGTKANELAAELSGAVTAGAAGEALAGDVVVLAVPYTAAADVVTRYGDQLAGKVVVDITNPLNATYDALVTPAGSSAAEEIAKVLPAGAALVKAFNTTFAGTLVAGQVAGQPLDVLVAGDDDAAKRTVSDLIEAGGLRAVDAGPLSSARYLEALGFLHIGLQGSLGTGFGSAVKFLS
jgi:8-hydroxy-5-deazaflavin:NADPH oxidoreductase